MSCFFLENYQEAINILEKNLRLLKNIKSHEIIKDEFFNFFSSDKLVKFKFDIIFIDPPYKEVKINEIIEKIIGTNLLNKDGIIIIHRHKKDVIKLTKKINIFEEQLLLAKSMDIPCIIHNRESDKELINSINKTKNNNGVIHCFASNLDLATELIKLGFHLSFTGLITFAKELKHVIENIPIEKIMIETDSPYLTPIPHRGKRNEPYMVKYIAMEIAKIKNIPFKQVATQTTKTAKKFFDI